MLFSQKKTDMISRKQFIDSLDKKVPNFRINQINNLLFDRTKNSYEQASNLPKDLVQGLNEKCGFYSIKNVKIFKSKIDGTFKGLFKDLEGNLFESVLMENSKGNFSICVSSQIGCAMGCTFCATGTMGFIRNLLAEEIVDQYRFWNRFIYENGFTDKRISNVVFMGMGEPLANYANVKDCINTWLEYTDLGPTKITVSTVGIIPNLQRLLKDDSWPECKIAISLHSYDPVKRKEIVPTSSPNFHQDIIDWSFAYKEKFPSKSHYITFEYTLIDGVNDSKQNAKFLAEFVLKTAFSKINVIPLNEVTGKSFQKVKKNNLQIFKDEVLKRGVDITQRKTRGDDINAACGQLVVNEAL
tara:strand:+ start:464 stop:1531 length:1068 start_codon:yes stop_codon:yes gene_type:complete